MHPFIVVNRKHLSVAKFSSAYKVALWLLGKDVRDYLIIKNEDKVISLKSIEMTKIQKELNDA